MRLSLALLFLLGAAAGADSGAIRLVGKTKYLNNARAIVAHTIDDSTKYVTNCIDAMDKYGIKATIFVSTEQDPAPEDRFLINCRCGNCGRGSGRPSTMVMRSAPTPVNILASVPIPRRSARRLTTITKSPDRGTISSSSPSSH